MATKKICDRCGAEINPPSSIAYALVEGQNSTGGYNDVFLGHEMVALELCVACSHSLKQWLAKEGTV